MPRPYCCLLAEWDGRPCTGPHPDHPEGEQS